MLKMKNNITNYSEPTVSNKTFLLSKEEIRYRKIQC